MKTNGKRGPLFVIAIFVAFFAVTGGVIAYALGGGPDRGSSSEVDQMRADIAMLRAEVATLHGRIGELQEKVRANEKRIAELNDAHDPKMLPLTK